MSDEHKTFAPAGGSAPGLSAVLTDLTSRFLANLPASELSNWPRIFYQLEQGFFFYSDFYADHHAHLPHFHLKSFAQAMFAHCAFLQPHKKQFEQLFAQFKDYLGQVPVCGAILLNSALTRCVMIRSWEGKSWSFPRGKINKDELDVDCAVREVAEEVGFDIKPLVSAATPFLTVSSKGKKIKLYVISNISEEQSKFETRTRKEISEIKWFNVNALPTMSTSNRAFAEKLHAFCKAQGKGYANANGSANGHAIGHANGAVAAAAAAGNSSNGANHYHNDVKQSGSSSGSGNGKNTPQRRRKQSEGGAAAITPSLARTKSATYGALPSGSAGGWSAEQMFATNEARFGVTADAVTDDLNITPDIEVQLKKFMSAKQIAQLKAKQKAQQQTQQQTAKKSQAKASSPKYTAASSSPTKPQQQQQQPLSKSARRRQKEKEKERGKDGATFTPNAGSGSGASDGWSAEQMFATNQSKFGVSAEAPAEDLDITPEVEQQLSKFFTAKQIAQLKHKHSAKVPPPINLHAAPVGSTSAAAAAGARSAPTVTKSSALLSPSAFGQPPAQQEFSIPKPPAIWDAAPRGAPVAGASPPRLPVGAAIESNPRPAAIASALMHVAVNAPAAAVGGSAGASAASAASAPVSIYDAIIRPMLSQPVTPVTPVTPAWSLPPSAPMAIPDAAAHSSYAAPASAFAAGPGSAVAAPVAAPHSAPHTFASPSTSLLQFKFDIDTEALFAATAPALTPARA